MLQALIDLPVSTSQRHRTEAANSSTSRMPTTPTRKPNRNVHSKEVVEGTLYRKDRASGDRQQKLNQVLH
jgi:hypothetical protein